MKGFDSEPSKSLISFCEWRAFLPGILEYESSLIQFANWQFIEYFAENSSPLSFEKKLTRVSLTCFCELLGRAFLEGLKPWSQAAASETSWAAAAGTPWRPRGHPLETPWKPPSRPAQDSLKTPWKALSPLKTLLRSQETLKTSLKTFLKPSSDLLKTLLRPPTSLKPS